MSDFERQLRDHYESHRLPEDRVRAILEAGRTAANRHRSRRRWLLSAAALVLATGGVYAVLRAMRPAVPAVPRLEPQDVASEVARYFSQPGYQLPRVSAEPRELVQWLRSQGAPASFALPPILAAMPSFGCHVLDVRGRRVFLICFFPDVTPAELAAGGMIKSEMVVTAPDGTTMKKNRPLVHLLFAPREIFREPPAPGARVALPSIGPWAFQSWARDSLVYVLAGDTTPERVAALAAML
jgi:hypothetical protein